MSKKVYELAKELDMESKELLEKINSMGVEAKGHNSTISDMDAQAVTNMILHNRKKTAETKIVTAGPAKKDSLSSKEEEVKIAVKPAAAVMMKMKEKTEQKPRAEGKPASQRTGAMPPAGTPLPRAASAAPPTGTPLARTASAAPPTGTPLPRTASATPPTGTPLPRAASAPPPGVPLPRAASKQPVKDELKDNEVRQESLPEALSKDREAKEIESIKADPLKTEPAKAETDKIERMKAEPVLQEPAKTETLETESAKPAPEKPEHRPAAAPQTVEDRRDRRPEYGDTRGRTDRKPEEQRAPGDQRGPRAPGDQRGPRTPGDQRGPRTPGDQRGPRTPGDQRGPRTPGDQRGPRTPGDQRGPRTPGDQRGPRTPGEQRDTREPRPDMRREAPSTGRQPAAAESGRGRPAPADSSKGRPDIKGKPDTRAKTDSKPDPRKDKEKHEKDKYGLKSMEKPAAKKPHKQKAQKPKEPERKIILEELEPGTKVVNVPITVKGLSEQIGKSTSDMIMALMKMGIMANINQNLDEDMVVLLGTELGISIVVDKIDEEIVEEGLELHEDKEGDLVPRPPIITVMGHVDHGKTSLLDAIRKTNVTITESGGITQHIGASEVVINGQKIVFLDTPGHEAFTTMRARGAHVTDIAVLVVAADDSVKPQTVESISHAKAAGVPIIVAVNKMDKPDANPERVKQDLTEHGILVEEWGGDTICVPVSAKTGDGIFNLLEMILLQAEVLELKANPNRLASGTVIEARLDKAKGPVATLLVLNGTLQGGNSVVAGTCCGRIRAMTNYKGDGIRKAGPATAVEITGLTEVPEAGDEFHAVKEDRIAREIAEQRRLKLREEVMAKNSSVTLEQLFSQIKEGEVKELNLIIKADVQGSVGALTQSLEKLQTENVKVRIIHTGVGTVTESDIMLASTSNAIIIGFNVRPTTNISALAERENVEIRSYRIIYEIIDDIEAALKGMLDPIYKEVILGKVEIRNTFKVPGVGMIGGAYVIEGKVQRNAEIRLLRDGIVVHEGKISSLKRYKDDAKEVAQGYECGIGIDNFNDIKEGDIVEVYKMEEVVRK